MFQEAFQDAGRLKMLQHFNGREVATSCKQRVPATRCKQEREKCMIRTERTVALCFVGFVVAAIGSCSQAPDDQRGKLRFTRINGAISIQVLELTPTQISLEVKNGTEYTLDGAGVHFAIVSNDRLTHDLFFEPVLLNTPNGREGSSLDRHLIHPGKSGKVVYSPRNNSAEARAYREDRIKDAQFLTVHDTFISFVTPPGRMAAMNHNPDSGLCLIRGLRLELVVPDGIVDLDGDYHGHPVSGLDDVPVNLRERFEPTERRALSVRGI